MFVKNGQPIDGSIWVAYSFDGSGKLETMVTTQPANATPAQLALMGITVQADPPPPPPPPPAVPEVISDRQFYQQLAVQGTITQNEAIAAVGPGTLPAKLGALINQLPANAQFDATMKATGAVQFLRSSPLVATLAQLFGWDGPTTDAFWTAASKLV